MKLTQRSKRMWKVVITEIQDASAIDPAYAPPGAFFVSTERFARTVKNLDLQRIISAINRMQAPLRGYDPTQGPATSERICPPEPNLFEGLECLLEA
jgi:hypothetical protein